MFSEVFFMQNLTYNSKKLVSGSKSYGKWLFLANCYNKRVNSAMKNEIVFQHALICESYAHI